MHHFCAHEERKHGNLVNSMIDTILSKISKHPTLLLTTSYDISFKSNVKDHTIIETFENILNENCVRATVV